MPDFPWYELLINTDQLEQGDIIREFPISIVPASELKDKNDEVGSKQSATLNIKVELYDVIIMSQTCDLIYKKLRFVLLCPVIELSQMVKISPSYNSGKMKEGLRRGYMPGYHMLNKCEIEGSESDYLIIDFRNVFNSPKI